MRLLVLGLIAVLLAACGGGATPPAAGSAAPSEPAAAAPSATTAASAAPSADAGPSFADILRTGKLTSYKVSYKMTTTGGGQPDASLEQTWYFKPPNTRFDMSTGDGYGGTSLISMFYLDTGSYMCMGSGSETSCLQVSADAAAAQNMGFEIQDSFQDDPSAFNASLKEKRTIAGQEAHCYVISGAAAALFTEGTFCYSSTGIPLLSQWAAGGGTFTMEATAFSTTVADSDFKLPATPQAIPTYAP